MSIMPEHRNFLFNRGASTGYREVVDYNPSCTCHLSSDHAQTAKFELHEMDYTTEFNCITKSVMSWFIRPESILCTDNTWFNINLTVHVYNSFSTVITA